MLPRSFILAFAIAVPLTVSTGLGEDGLNGIGEMLKNGVRCRCAALKRSLDDQRRFQAQYQTWAQKYRHRIDDVVNRLHRPYSENSRQADLVEFTTAETAFIMSLEKQAKAESPKNRVQTASTKVDKQTGCQIDPSSLQKMKRASCPEVFAAVQLHEQLHWLRCRKRAVNGRLGKETAADIAEEEVAAYEVSIQAVQKQYAARCKD